MRQWRDENENDTKIDHKGSSKLIFAMLGVTSFFVLVGFVIEAFDVIGGKFSP